ncbi:phage major capsid protein [Chelativorans sp. J32]|uniref:phage major capsid family protein n=1 Tax=Chelativorans sp. J32 TaxID=935840 RepID=UPI000489B4FB|nr:phage major capsid protein [Chelativorans sp. J32]
MVRTKGIAQGQFMVGGFVGNTILWQRKGIEVRRSTEDRDNFIANKVTILLEERIQLETLRPEGIVYGPLTTPAP